LGDKPSIVWQKKNFAVCSCCSILIEFFEKILFNVYDLFVS